MALASLTSIPGELADWFAGVDPRFLTLALLLQLGSLALRSIAWRNVLAAAYPDARVRLLDAAGPYVAGVALNGYVPARGGEVAKIALARTRIPGSSVPTIVSSLSVVMLLDSVVSVSLLVGAWAFGLVPHVPGLVSLAGYLASVREHWLVAAPVAVVAVVGLWLLVRRAIGRARTLRAGVEQGFAILRQPRRYLRTVVLVQLAAWCCRIGVVYAFLQAFHVHATLAVAALVVVIGGLSTTLSVTPGGAGTQQLAHAYALQGTAAAASAVSFSIGMQISATLLNTVAGLAALMLMFRTARPAHALRLGLRVARAARRADSAPPG